jgi:hypothetical protein
MTTPVINPTVHELLIFVINEKRIREGAPVLAPGELSTATENYNALSLLGGKESRQAAMARWREAQK